VRDDTVPQSLVPKKQEVVLQKSEAEPPDTGAWGTRHRGGQGALSHAIEE
jgi:hypothetical protein